MGVPVSTFPVEAELGWVLLPPKLILELGFRLVLTILLDPFPTSLATLLVSDSDPVNQGAHTLSVPQEESKC